MSRRNAFAAASFAVAAVLTAIGTFKDDGDSVGEWLLVLAISAAVAAILFWVVVPRVGESAGVAALVLAVLGFVSLGVFWTGLPSVFAGAAAYLGLAERDRREGRPALAYAALAVAALVVVLAIVLAIVG